MDLAYSSYESRKMHGNIQIERRKISAKAKLPRITLSNLLKLPPKNRPANYPNLHGMKISVQSPHIYSYCNAISKFNLAARSAGIQAAKRMTAMPLTKHAPNKAG
jgi:hypothetical protein